MHPTIQVDPETSIISITLKGEVNGRDLVEINGEVAQQLEYKYQIWHFLDSSPIKVTPIEMHTIARQDWVNASNSNLKKVALVGEAKDLKHVFEFYELYSNYWVGRPNNFVSCHFATLGQARAWIDSSPD